MADNVTIPATGSGTATPIIAADDVSSVFYQKIKLDGGGNGLTVPIVAGQQIASESLPVVLPAAQITTLTPPAAITGFATSAKQDTGNTSLASIDGKITAVNTGAVVLAAGTAEIGKLAAGVAEIGNVKNSGTFATQAAQSGTWTVQPGNTANTTAWKVDGSAVTQPISAASLPLPSGAATETSVAASAAVEGTTTGAAVITDANGTIQQYLRGIVKLLITSGTIILGTGANLIGYVGQKRTYAAKATITWTGTSLANGSARESTVIDNTTNRYQDVRIRIQSKGQAGGTLYIDWYVYTALGDTTYTDNATGSDAAFTAANRLNSRYLGSTRLSTTVAQQSEFQMSDIFGTCPSKWGLIGINNSGAALSATAGDHVLEYEGIN